MCVCVCVREGGGGDRNQVRVDKKFVCVDNQCSLIFSMLSDVSHVIMDEVHERSIQSDFLQIILRDLLPKRYITAYFIKPS